MKSLSVDIEFYFTDPTSNSCFHGLYLFVLLLSFILENKILSRIVPDRPRIKDNDPQCNPKIVSSYRGQVSKVRKIENRTEV